MYQSLLKPCKSIVLYLVFSGDGIILNRFNRGRSEDIYGHCMTLMLLPCKTCVVTWPVYGRALSCWIITGPF